MESITFFNKPSGRNIYMEIAVGEKMHPSASTRLLIEHCKISQGDSVLDLGCGTGVIGIAAAVLGAASVTFTDIDTEAVELARENAARSLGTEDKLRFITSDLFHAFGYERFDKIVVNPPSIPCPEGVDLPLQYCGGGDGRDLHNAIQHLAPYYLTEQGALVTTHSSLADIDESLAALESKGFHCELSESLTLPFREFYPTEHIETLAHSGRLRYQERDGVRYEERLVITAWRSSLGRTRVMEALDAQGTRYRKLPHKRVAKTVALAAEERKVPVEEMIKCILLKDKQSKFVLACLPGDLDLDAQRVRDYARGYARLSFASPEEISQLLGFELGSVAPISLTTAVPIVLDERINRSKLVNISSGDPRIGLELERAKLLELIPNATLGRISK